MDMLGASAESPDKLSLEWLCGRLAEHPRRRWIPKRGSMRSLRLRRLTAALMLVLCAVSLGATLLPVGASATHGPSGCGPSPAWIESATVPAESESPLPSCFASSSGHAEAVLSIVNNRPYAQLITVSGATLDLAESSFHDSLEAALSRMLDNSSSPNTPSLFLLGPAEEVSLTIDRPPPGAAQVVHIDPASDNDFAVAALAWRLLSTAAKHLSLPAGVEDCIAQTLDEGLSDPPQPELSLRQIHACVNASGLSGEAQRLLRKLAGSLLRDDYFHEVIHREGTEPHPARIAYTVAASDPYLVNPAIHLTATKGPEVPAGGRTVTHLTAAGGAPPYRFYFVPEAGGPGVPDWVKLAADGTLVIEPPVGSTVVDVPVEVVDSNGEHSDVAY